MSTASGPEWRYEPARDHGLAPAARLRSIDRENGLVELLLQAGFGVGVRTWLALAHRLRIEGRERLPVAAPFVLVANHCSHLDALSLAAALPRPLRRRAFPIAAGDHFFATPTLSWFAAFVINALPMWRRNCGRHALADLQARLGRGDAVFVLFPEGTRSRDGTMAPFKPGVGMLVAGTSIPVVPCGLRGTFAALPPHRRVPRPARIRLTIGTPRTFEREDNEPAAWRRIAAMLEADVRVLVGGS